MSRQPIALSPDLLKLQNEGYDLDIRGGYLLVRDIPYVNAARSVERGTLIVALDLAANITIKPKCHTTYWAGEHPCFSDGRKLNTIENPSQSQNLGDGIFANFMFSAKADYRDFYHKVTTYVGRIAGEAGILKPEAVPQTFPAIPSDSDEGVFKYVDTASSRAGIGALNDRIAGQRILIIGLGGTGSYILDLVCKTAVAEIHLAEGDVFSQHNAFRAPGAASFEELRGKPHKVAYFHKIYSQMRSGIIAHDEFIDEKNISLIDGFDFVFLCLDRGAAKRAIVERLIANKTPFVEVGMGVLLSDGKLSGIVRVATSTVGSREKAAPHISYAADDGVANEYSTNIQIAELNALNAALAVIRWKRLFGFYQDARDEYHGGYSIATGEIVVEGTK